MIQQQTQIEPTEVRSANATPIKVGILGATFETGNMGLGALAAGTVQCIRYEYPNAGVFLMDYLHEETVRTVRIDGEYLTVPLLNLRFSKKIFLPNNIALLIFLTLVSKLIPSQKLKRKFINRNRYLREIAETHLFVSLAGGDSFADVYGFSRLVYVALPQLLVLLAGKRLILMPQTYGPFRGAWARAIARFILRRAEMIYSRDVSGAEGIVSMLGLPSSSPKVRFCYDVGFLLEPDAPAHLGIEGISLRHRSDTTLVGVNVSGLLLMEGYTRNNMFGLKVSYRSLILRVLEHLLKDPSVSVLLVPHVFGEEAGSETDTLACNAIFEELKGKYEGRLGTVRGRHNQNEIKYIIGQCDFFIGSRMHACIAAVSQSVPAVSIAYTDKFIGVMKAVGVESLVADPRSMTTDEILAHVSGNLRDRETLHRQLLQKMPEVKRTILNTIADEISTLAVEAQRRI
jgi:polysaccharide pyruvyl transferase WcaK-like protein